MDLAQHSTPTLLMALELGNTTWRIAFDNGQKVSQVQLGAGRQDQLLRHLAQAKQRLGLPPEAPVWSCYEAGRDGFWIHRMLASHGIANLVVDPASIEVNRRARRCKTDRLDAAHLVGMLRRYRWGNERTLWRVVQVPGEAAEDARRPFREQERLQRECTAHQSRLRSLLALQGIKGTAKLTAVDFGSLLAWQGQVLPPELLAELRREQARLNLAQEQLAALRAQTRERGAAGADPAAQGAAKLAGLRGVGISSGSVLMHEFFGWRQFRNRRQVGAAAGLTGTPYDSGEGRREQGIDKAGNPRVRNLMVQLAWGWLRWQPQSELAQWFARRFAGSPRLRRIGIVAVARKLLVALWRYLAEDLLPAGAVLRPA